MPALVLFRCKRVERESRRGQRNLKPGSSASKLPVPKTLLVGVQITAEDLTFVVFFAVGKRVSRCLSQLLCFCDRWPALASSRVLLTGGFTLKSPPAERRGVSKPSIRRPGHELHTSSAQDTPWGQVSLIIAHPLSRLEASSGCSFNFIPVRLTTTFSLGEVWLAQDCHLVRRAHPLCAGHWRRDF